LRPVDDRAERVSAAFRPENVAFIGGQEDLQRIAAAGPRGAVALAGDWR